GTVDTARGRYREDLSLDIRSNLQFGESDAKTRAPRPALWVRAVKRQSDQPSSLLKRVVQRLEGRTLRWKNGYLPVPHPFDPLCAGPCRSVQRRCLLTFDGHLYENRSGRSLPDLLAHGSRSKQGASSLAIARDRAPAGMARFHILGAFSEF